MNVAVTGSAEYRQLGSPAAEAIDNDEAIDDAVTR
jgi:hypothetical protein